MIKKYRKNPLEVEAVQITEANQYFVQDWCGGKLCGRKLPPKDREIAIMTRQGELWAELGDYVVKDLGGNFYPYKAYLFQVTHSESENKDDN